MVELMTFIILLIIAFMIGYGIVLMKENISVVDEINRAIRQEIEMQQLERKQRWEDTNKQSKTS
jgi:TM2 domain-containing membrane protein YozV